VKTEKTLCALQSSVVGQSVKGSLGRLVWDGRQTGS
jgi:hypothetical protein